MRRYRTDPSWAWELSERVLNATFIPPTPFSTQGLWTIAPLQNRFALPNKRQAHSGPVDVDQAHLITRSEGPLVAR